jgi:NADPH2:quinone reductase
VVTEHTVYPIPPGIAAGAALHLATSYATAYGALVWTAKLAPGETLLVLAAAGGVGLAAVEIGRVLGAHVIAAAGGAEKCAVARAHGAQAAIDCAAWCPAGGMSSSASRAARFPRSPPTSCW